MTELIGWNAILKKDTIINLDNLDFGEVTDKIDNASDKNKNKFIEENCKNREFLKNILIENEYFYNNAIKKIFWNMWILKAWFLAYPDEEYYWVENMDEFLDEVESIIYKNIFYEIQKNRKSIDKLSWLMNLYDEENKDDNWPMDMAEYMSHL